MRVALFAICAIGFAQAPSHLAFEVVSVKVAPDSRDGHQTELEPFGGGGSGGG